MLAADSSDVVLVAWLAVSIVAAIVIAVQLMQRPVELGHQDHERDVQPAEHAVQQSCKDTGKTAPTPILCEPEPLVSLEGVVFQIWQMQTGRFVWTFLREGTALGFVRDVVRLRSHQDAAQFELRMVCRAVVTSKLAEGEQLVKLALQDRVL